MITSQPVRNQDDQNPSQISSKEEFSSQWISSTNVNLQDGSDQYREISDQGHTLSGNNYVCVIVDQNRVQTTESNSQAWISTYKSLKKEVKNC